MDFVYDQFDRISKKIYTKATIPFKQFASEKEEQKTTHEYSYTNSGKRKSLVVAFSDGSKKVTEWSYDKFGRLAKIKDNGQEVVYKYDEKSRISEKVIAGISEFYEYDTQNRLVRKTLQGRALSPKESTSPIAELKYSYSKDGMITAREVNGQLQNYEYDLKGQLTGVKDKDGEYVEQYVYDKAGNILKKAVDGKTTTFEYDAANQLATAVLPDGSRKTFEYDGAGRLTNDGDKTYAYGWMDKVFKVEENGKVASFEYWADGQIAERLANNKEEIFYWDRLALIRRDTTDYTIDPHANGGNPILASGKILFNDMLGNSLGTFEKGKYSEINREAFGEASSANFSDFFTGKPNIEGLGYAFLLRNYRSDLGKWQTVDPLGYPDGWNNLTYCNNSVSWALDPLGAYIGVNGNATFTGYVNAVIDAAAHSDTTLGRAIVTMRDAGRTDHWTTINQDNQVWPQNVPNSIISGGTISIGNYDYRTSDGTEFDPIKALLHELCHASGEKDDATANAEADALIKSIQDVINDIRRRYPSLGKIFGRLSPDGTTNVFDHRIEYRE